MGSRGSFSSQDLQEFDDLEIVGFDGIVLPNVHCDASLPVVRRKSTDIFLILRSNYSADEAIGTFTRSEFDQYKREGRITAIPGPIPAFADAVVVYVSRELIRRSGYQLEESFEDWRIKWEKLDDSILFCCIPEKVSTKLLNTWACLLLSVADNLLMQGLPKDAGVDTTVIEDICDMALDAARDPGIVERAYLRLGVALFHSDAVERLMGLYPLILEASPNWTKAAFLQQVTDMAELLLAKARLARPQQEEQDESLEEGPNLSSLSKLAVNLAANVSKLNDSGEQLKEATEAAALFRNARGAELGSEEAAVDAFVERIRERSHLYLDDNDVKLLAAYSYFYLPDVISVGEDDKPMLSLQALHKASKDMVLQLDGQDPISAYALSSEE